MTVPKQSDTDERPPLPDRAFACVRLRWTPLLHNALNQVPRSLYPYLAEPLPTGQWRLYQGIAIGEARHWEAPAFLVDADALEAQFDIFGEPLPLVEKSLSAADLFCRPLPGDNCTYEVREQLTELGGRWVKAERVWAIPVGQWEEAQLVLSFASAPVPFTPGEELAP